MASSDNRRSPKWPLVLIFGSLTLCFLGCLGVVGLGVRLWIKGRDAVAAITAPTAPNTPGSPWPKVPPNGKPLVILIRSAVVTETAANGKPWDKDQTFVRPDLYVRVTISDKKLEDELTKINAELNSPKRPRVEPDPERKKELERRRVAIIAEMDYETWTVEDRYTANFKDEPAGLLGLAVGDRVRLRVFDDDVAFDEIAGEFEILITQDMIGKEIEKSGGQVTSLKFIIRPR